MKQLYHSYDDVKTVCEDLCEHYPDLFRLEVIGQTWEKRDIYLLTISLDVEKADIKPALFYTGTIHAREWIGLELAVHFAEHVARVFDYDPVIRDVFSASTFYMVPCANPDGYEYSRNHFSFWRKNRRQNADGSYGVDLNRNFPIGFVKSTSPSSNVYGGPEPFSEPETRALKNFVDTHKNIAIALDYHSQGNVFFPAHDFRHEDTIDTTDLNVLCANMAEEARKVSNRLYGIHQGKPPAKLIGGSGREYYYSKGIIASVVEVGAQNISDYMDVMKENIHENIPALLAALKETPNYCRTDGMTRPDNFRATRVNTHSVTLGWEYEDLERATYFEIYRGRKAKSYCRPFNLMGVTQALRFIDFNLSSDTTYYYHIRAVNKLTGRKSPLAPVLRIRTRVADDEFHRTYQAVAAKTGYVAENTKDNASHFGVNSLFVGIDDTKGISYGMITFGLKTIPENAVIKKAKLLVYPLNRVSVTIENFGEWSIGMIDQDSLEKIDDFESVHQAKLKCYVGRPFNSEELSQGIWKSWEFSERECERLQEDIAREEVLFRVEGPKKLPVGRTRQMMQWDIGYGKFGGGLAFRPYLEITYTEAPKTVELFPSHVATIEPDATKPGVLSTGFDGEGKQIIGSFAFDLASLPAWEYTQIVSAHIELNPVNVYVKEHVRFHLEMTEECADQSYIGYDVSVKDLKNEEEEVFVFDTFALLSLSNALKEKCNPSFLLTPSSAQRIPKNERVEWHTTDPAYAPKLVIEYLNKRRFDVGKVENLSYTIENDKIRLSWKNPDNKDFKGVFVIKNPFRKPISHYDGDKLYGGPDNWTYDDFGALDVKKYYAVFTYDDVPNFSDPVILEYTPPAK